MTHATLLPSNRTPWEEAVATVELGRRPPAEIVGSVLNPDTCPAHMLSYMAAALSLDIWDESWDEVKKRETCRKALLLHRIKTTAAGIRAHVSLTGSEVKRIIRPPAKGFRYAAFTEEQRKAWLERLPQIRVYPFFRRAVAVRRTFYSGPGGRQFRPGRSYELTAEGYATPMLPGLPEIVSVSRFGVNYARPSRGAGLLGRRATYFDRGVEIEVQYSALDDGITQRIFIARNSRRDWRGAGFYGHIFGAPSRAQENVVTIRTDESLGLAAIGRGVEPVDVRPQRVAQRRTAPASRAFSGRFRAGTFRRESFGPLLIYDKISLHDPTRIGARRTARSYYGYGRYGIPDYTAELRIAVPMRRGRRRSGKWYGVGFRKAADMRPLNMAIEAVRVSKALRDNVLIDTTTFSRVTFSSELRFGEFDFGDIKEVR